jgi:hypothetical protein
MSKKKFVLVTTGYKGVFAGEVDPKIDLNNCKNIELNRCRCCIYWSGKSGFLGLASHGPEEGSRLGALVEGPVFLRKVTSISTLSQDAVDGWGLNE